MTRNERRNLMGMVRKMTGQKVSEITFPGGKSRKSVRVHFADGKSAIATRRRTDQRREHEIDVMKTLSQHGGPVPRVLGVRGDLMLQEDLGETRLSQHLHQVGDDPAQVAAALDQSVDALARIHEAAEAGGLAERSQLIGADPKWIDGLLRCPSEIEDALGLTVPGYLMEPLQTLLRVREPRFVKWDSRPGNALLRDGRAYWFDWEHSGARNALDDLVWLMCDEFVTYRPDMEAAILSRHMDRFSKDFASPDEALDYFGVMAVFHTVVRLSLIIQNKGSGPWWGTTYCVEGDKVGITLRCARRLVWRGAAWADKSAFTRPLAEWFRELEGHFEAA